MTVQDPDVVETVDIVAYLYRKPDGHLAMEAVRHKPSQPAVAVMTVEQHERLMATQAAEYRNRVAELHERSPRGDSEAERLVADLAGCHVVPLQQGKQPSSVTAGEEHPAHGEVTWRVVDNLSALVRQLVQRLRKAAPADDLSDRAMDYLKRENLQGSPLRSTVNGRE